MGLVANFSGTSKVRNELCSLSLELCVEASKQLAWFRSVYMCVLHKDVSQKKNNKEKVMAEEKYVEENKQILKKRKEENENEERN